MNDQNESFLNKSVPRQKWRFGEKCCTVEQKYNQLMIFNLKNNYFRKQIALNY